MKVNVGDILGDRDSRRKGRKVEVIWVDPSGTHVTVKTIKDADDAVKSSIGNTTDVKTERLPKAYKLLVQSSADEKFVGGLKGLVSEVSNTFEDTFSFYKYDFSFNKYDYMTPEEEEELPEDPLSLDTLDEWRATNGFTGPEEDDVIEDTNDLEDALNSVGYHFVPDLEDLQEQLDGYLHSLSKKDVVELVHRTITEL